MNKKQQVDDLSMPRSSLGGERICFIPAQLSIQSHCIGFAANPDEHRRLRE